MTTLSHKPLLTNEHPFPHSKSSPNYQTRHVLVMIVMMVMLTPGNNGNKATQSIITPTPMNHVW